jgi:hypothetical protein
VSGGHRGDLLGGDPARNDVVGEDLVEHCLVFRLDEILNGPCGQLCKRFIRRRKDSEWPFARKGVDQPARLDGGDERGVIL